MQCDHPRIRCVDNVFFCTECGALLPEYGRPMKTPVQEEKPQEGPQKPVKRKTKKEREKV